MKIQIVFEKFIKSRKLKGLAKRTIKDYEEFIGLFIKYIGKDKNIEDLTQEDIEDYEEYQIDRDISRATLSTYLRHFKIFIRWVCEQNYEVQFTYKLINIPKAYKKNILIYSDKEIMMIFDVVGAYDEWIVLRNKAILSFMLDSGLRQGEISSLKDANICMERGRMTVLGKGTKERIVPLGKLSIQLYTEYRNKCPYKSEYAFVSKIGKYMTNNSIKLMVAKLNQKLPFRISSHKLRHNFATNYCLDMYQKNGCIDIYRLMTIMGHEDIDTTRRYLHMANEIIASSECLSHMDKVYRIC
ncbi:MAG: tyrosine-type recombinase/integrase [Clostridia bacterium]|nr:tyrosine-type recombinase/integrase [Clostridia bacterium]